MLEIILFITVVWLVFYVISLSHKVYNLEVKFDKLQGQKTTVTGADSATVQERVVGLDGVVTPQAENFSENFNAWKTEHADTQASDGPHFDTATFIAALPKIGIVALVIGLGFFLKYAIDQGWISELLRLIIGGGVASLFLLLSYLWYEKYKRYALILAGGGLAIWYLTIYAAVNLYGFLNFDFGLITLLVVTFSGWLIAKKTGSKEMAILSWGAAYLSPIVLGITAETYTLVLVYITILTAALLLAATYSKGKYLFVVAIAGLAVNFIVSASSINHTLETFYLYTLIALTVNFVLASIYSTYSTKHPEGTSADDTDNGIMYCLTYVALGLPMLGIVWGEFRATAPLFAAAMGFWTLLIYSMVDRLEKTSINYILAAASASLLSIAIVWQFSTEAQVVMLYLLGLIGLFIGQVQKRTELRALSLAVILFGIVASFGVPYGNYYERDVLLLNVRFGLQFMGVIALVVSYKIFREDELTTFEKDIHKGLLYGIATLFWLIVSIDLYSYFESSSLEDQANLALSIWWLVYAVGLIVVSSVKQLNPLRKIALLLFGLAILKVFLIDLQTLDTLYRIISFISLGGILLIISFVYQKNKQQIKDFLDIHND